MKVNQRPRAQANIFNPCSFANFPGALRALIPVVTIIFPRSSLISKLDSWRNEKKLRQPFTTLAHYKPTCLKTISSLPVLVAGFEPSDLEL
jgi:hypothetical protein